MARTVELVETAEEASHLRRAVLRIGYPISWQLALAILLYALVEMFCLNGIKVTTHRLMVTADNHK